MPLYPGIPPPPKGTCDPIEYHQLPLFTEPSKKVFNPDLSSPPHKLPVASILIAV